MKLITTYIKHVNTYIKPIHNLYEPIYVLYYTTIESRSAQSAGPVWKALNGRGKRVDALMG